MAKKHCRPLPHLAHVQVNRANLNPVLLNLHALLLCLPNVGASDCKAWTPRPQKLDERNEISDLQLKHMVMIAHHCYQSFDLAARAVDTLSNRGAIVKGALQKYIDLLR